jgi:metal-dependent amidase/aminoacylase/carboxypeptidase family protein
MRTSRLAIRFVPVMLGSVMASAASQVTPAERRLPALLELYRQLHRAPELSFQEERTAARLAEELRGLGFTVTTKVGGHGVVGVLENGDGPTVLFWLGSVDEATLATARKAGTLPGLHSATFAPQPETSLRTGVRAMAAAVVELLGK